MIDPRFRVVVIGAFEHGNKFSGKSEAKKWNNKASERFRRVTCPSVHEAEVRFCRQKKMTPLNRRSECSMYGNLNR